jgi:hypothetical protein
MAACALALGAGVAVPSARAVRQPVVSAGLARTGALALQAAGYRGAPLTIAILDLGFGSDWPGLQALGELPPAQRLEMRSFDPQAGLAGTGVYGDPIDHGQLVAQTVYDYAPDARYIFVNYHTPSEFVSAVDWLITQNPDIVVHSNNFLTGPFDGTSAPAQAVDRAAAAGILWFNSAGNYALKHWSGAWVDRNGDRALDWPGGWTFARAAGEPTSFSLTWESPAAGPATDLALLLQRQDAGGGWTTVASGTPQGSNGAWSSAEFIDYQPPADGVFRLRIALAGGPPPVGNLTLFSRELPLAAIGGGAAGSVPTPADAAGSVSVGAVDIRNDAPEDFSSQGPTADGRLGPDLVAPTNTAVATGPSGRRDAGGTSIAAPNAAGAAAVLWSFEDAIGLAPTAASIRAELEAEALDLGPPGPDSEFGAGRVRVVTAAPSIALLAPAEAAVVRGRIPVMAAVRDPLPVASWSVAVDGAPLLSDTAGAPSAWLDTRTLPDGPHALQVSARDATGNQASETWPFVVDNTPPLVALRRVEVSPEEGVRRAAELAPRRFARRAAPARRRRVSIVAALNDESGLPMRLRVRVVGADGRVVVARTVTGGPTGGRRVALGPVRRGRYKLELQVLDRAGNRTRLRRPLVLR